MNLNFRRDFSGVRIVMRRQGGNRYGSEGETQDGLGILRVVLWDHCTLANQ